jgi:Putative adhesin
MSSVPPNMPPGGGQPPYGAYDPKVQWRAYREQQKAAWRAQKDAMKAQRYAAKAGYYGGGYAPRVPSIVGPLVLITIGVIALLIYSGYIVASSFWSWYANWWPLMLILAGVALLAEWAIDARSKTPVRRGGSFFGVLILLAVIGMGAAGWNHWWGPFRSQFGDNDDFFNAFGEPEHDLDQPNMSAQIPADASIQIDNPRGDVSITAGDTNTIQVQAHDVAHAGSDSEAKKIFDAETAHLTVNGSSVVLKSGNNSNGKVNLTVTVPKTAHLTVNSGWDDVTAAGLGAGINVTARGDIHLDAITGPVEAHFTNGRHDTFTAHDVHGDLNLNGDLNDLTISGIKGSVTQNGEILGDVHIENIAGSLHLHTTVTTLDLGELPGDLTLSNDDLRVSEAKGTVHVTTHSKDIDLSQIYGDTYVQDRDGRIAIEPAGNYSIDAKNSKGDIELTLPLNASANVSAHTHNGDIVSDYPMPSNDDEDNKTANFNIGSGSSKVVLSADNGDIHVKKGTNAPTAPPAPAIGDAPTPPASPKAPHHLAAPKAPPQPVSQ